MIEAAEEDEEGIEREIWNARSRMLRPRLLEQQRMDVACFWVVEGGWEGREKVNELEHSRDWWNSSGRMSET
jgi:hypothetical protein